MTTKLKSHYRIALDCGVHPTSRKIETRRHGRQWHAPLRTFDDNARVALSLGQVVRNAEQGFDAFPAGPRFINVRFTIAE
jgi:hypothetical protein